MKKNFFIILLISCCIFALSRFISFAPPVVHITMQPIPRNNDATEKRSEGSYQIFTRRSQDKECGCRTDICESATHKCIEWEKRYITGQLESYTVYEAKSLPQMNEHLEEKVYFIAFDAKNKISRLGNKNGVQYFDENGNIIKVCDSFGDEPFGVKTCWERNKIGLWTSSTEHWIE